MKKQTCLDIKNKKGIDSIIALTAYDYCMASWFQDLDLDIVLVGDSLAMVSHGDSSTLKVTMDEMIMHTRSVSQARLNSLLVADMPFMSYHASIDQALSNAGRFIKEANAEAVKLEGGSEIVKIVQAIKSIGIPVMGHIGMNPQKMLDYGGFKIQGKKSDDAHKIIHDAMDLEQAGAFALVLECIPYALAQEITNKISIPTIGIGAGPYCDGQILVTQDVLGMTKHQPKFVQRYANFQSLAIDGLKKLIGDINQKKYPDLNHSYKSS